MRGRAQGFVLACAFLSLIYPDAEQARADGRRTFGLRAVEGTRNVTAIAQSSVGALWFVQEGQLCRYEGEGVRCLAHPRNVMDVASTPQGDLLILSAGSPRLHHLAATGGEPDVEPTRIPLPPRATSLCWWRDTAWVVVNTKLVEMLGRGVEKEIEIGETIEATLATRRGALLIGTRSGVLQLDAVPGRPVPYDTGEPEVKAVTALAENAEGELWLGTAEGLWNHGRIVPYNSQVEGAFSQRATDTVAVGADGSVWLGGRSGLLQLQRDPPIQVFASAEGLGGEMPFSVVARSATDVWMTDNNGATHWDGNAFHRMGVANGFAHIDLRSLAPDPEGDFWFAGYRSGLWRFLSGKANAVTVPRGVDGPGVRSLLTLKNGALLIAFDEGGLVVRKTTGHFVPVVFDEPKPPRVGPMVEHGDSVWVGFRDEGLGRLRAGRLQRVSSTELQDRPVQAIAIEPNSDSVWLGTMSGIFRVKQGTTQSVSVTDGLPSNAIHSLVLDERMRLWAGTDRGLFVVGVTEIEAFWAGRLGKLSPLSFDTRDGLRANETVKDFFPAAAITTEGKLWQPTVNGMVVVDTRRFPEDLLPPKVAIVDLSSGGRFVLPNDASIPLGGGDLSFRISAPVFVNAHRLVVRYRVHRSANLRSEEEWTETSGTREVKLRDLAAGTVTLEAQAFFRHQPTRTTEIRRTLTLTPPFYRRFPFLLGVLLAGALLFAQFYRARTVKMKNRYEEILAERRRISRDMHDTLQQDLVGLKFHIETVLLAQEIAGPSRLHLEKAAELAQEGIRDLRDSISGLAASSLSVAALRQRIAEQVNRLFAGTNTKTEVSLEGAGGNLSVRTATSVLQVVRECVTNVHKHARATQLTIHLDSNGETLTIGVKDNGIGFDINAIARGTSGLENMRFRARDAGMTLAISSKPGEGCVVQLVATIVKET